MKYLYYFFCIVFFTSSLNAQDPVTNAFEDLARKGSVEDSISEMNIPCTTEALRALLKEKPSCGFFCFTEDRSHDIRMLEKIPARWAKRDAKSRNQFYGNCQPGEYFVWQIGLFTPFKKLENISVVFSDFVNEHQHTISTTALTCFNLGGVDLKGNTFVKNIHIDKGYVQPLWIGMNIPPECAGTYRGTIRVSAAGTDPCIIDVALKVEGDPLSNSGDDEGWRKSRLRWLDMQTGNDQSVTKPYIPLRSEQQWIRYLGGEMELSQTGLPKQITTYYDQNNQLDPSMRTPVLADAITFIIETPHGIEQLKADSLRMISKSGTEITWQAKQHNQSFEIVCESSFHFDGFTRFEIQVKAKKPVEIKDIRLEVPYTRRSSKYMMGLGMKGGYRRDSLIQWKWDITKHQDKVWMGAVNSGLNFTFKDRNYKRPLVNIYYDLGKLQLPESWGNEGKGGIQIIPTDEDKVCLQAYSGSRRMEKDALLFYDFEMLITPVKPINPDRHFRQRFYHSNSDKSENYISESLKKGANIINIHSKKDIYPFINYPYYDDSYSDLKGFINEAHQHGLKTRVYYTTRELTIKIPELWALRSLEGEVIYDGPGKQTKTLIHPNGPHQWLNENIVDHFIPAWYNAFNEGKYRGVMDLSVITTPDSRWNNYYLEGLDWMVKQLKIDGIYIDDSALDRYTLQRARRILDADGSERLIDLHSWNHMNQWAGYSNSLHIYTDLLPSIDRVWIGEGFTENNPLDFWLVEMSGIPFGLMSETLDAHTIFKGMIFGMLPRLPWSGNPVPMWKLIDSFRSKEIRMAGFWNKDNPIRTTNEHLPLTVYYSGNKILLAIANWTNTPQQARLSIDMDKLGFTPSKIFLPKIETIQNDKIFHLAEPFEVEGNSGIIIQLEK